MVGIAQSLDKATLPLITDSRGIILASYPIFQTVSEGKFSEVATTLDAKITHMGDPLPLLRRVGLLWWLQQVGRRDDPPDPIKKEDGAYGHKRIGRDSTSGLWCVRVRRDPGVSRGTCLFIGSFSPMDDYDPAL